MTGRARTDTALLDVNVLVALVMPNHDGHESAVEWFHAHAPRGWATTPVTESGFVRVSSNRRAIPTATTPAIALEMLGRLTAQPGHVFWPDRVTGVIRSPVPAGSVVGYRQVTDAHLLSVAADHGGRLITLDRAVPALVPDAPDLVEVLEAGPRT